jgi:hypothetical protein
MSKQIKICFSDFWGLFNYEDNFIIKMLKNRYDVIVDNVNPDFVIYSTYGSRFLKYHNAIKILFISENVRPNYWECDFSLSFDYSSNNGKNLRYPLYVMYGFIPQLLEKKCPDTILANKPNFCNMVVSNSNCKVRNNFFKLLNKKKNVDSGGKYLNNIGGPVNDKLNFIKSYRFSLAFENSSYPGYTTEKIFEPMKVNSIPIYWGNELIGKEFNVNSFINVHSYTSLNDAANAVLELEHDKIKLSQMLMEPWFIDNKLTDYFSQERFCEFFDTIFNSKKSLNYFIQGTRQVKVHTSVFRKKIKAKILSKNYCHVS